MKKKETLKPKIRILAINDKDKKKAEIMQKWLDHEWIRYEHILGTILGERSIFETVYAIRTPDRIWDNILKAVIEWDIEQSKISEIKP